MISHIQEGIEIIDTSVMIEMVEYLGSELVVMFMLMSSVVSMSIR